MCWGLLLLADSRLKNFRSALFRRMNPSAHCIDSLPTGRSMRIARVLYLCAVSFEVLGRFAARPTLVAVHAAQLRPTPGRAQRSGGSTKPDRWIAEKCGVHHVLVGKGRAELVTVTGSNPRTGQDGKTRLSGWFHRRRRPSLCVRLVLVRLDDAGDAHQFSNRYGQDRVVSDASGKEMTTLPSPRDSNFIVSQQPRCPSTCIRFRM
jgi:hypothetical protein